MTKNPFLNAVAAALTKSQKQALMKAKKDYKLGKTLTLDELESKLGFTRQP